MVGWLVERLPGTEDVGGGGGDWGGGDRLLGAMTCTRKFARHRFRGVDILAKMHFSFSKHGIILFIESITYYHNVSWRESPPHKTRQESTKHSKTRAIT